MTTLHDPQHLQAFKRAISQIAGRPDPPRAKLREIGRELALLAGRTRPWGGAHLYTLLHPERWPKYGVHRDLLQAALLRVSMAVIKDKERTTVLARGVRAGAVVLARSRKCGRRRCPIHFVPVTPNQVWCSDECAQRAKASRRKQRRQPRVGTR